MPQTNPLVEVVSKEGVVAAKGSRWTGCATNMMRLDPLRLARLSSLIAVVLSASRPAADDGADIAVGGLPQ